MGFGFGNEASEPVEEQADWANFGDDAQSTPQLPLDFAKPSLEQILDASQPGQKGVAGFKVCAHFFMNEAKQLTFGLELSNMTQQTLVQDFDVRFNKNAFAVCISNATNALTLPTPGQSTYVELPCTIDKKNLDGKNPPKNPFMVQVAMKTSLDVFVFQVPCLLHCLMNQAKQMTEQDYQTNWQKIKDANILSLNFAKSQLYGGYSQASNVIDAMA